MKHLLHLVIAALLFSSCSVEKRASKAIKRIGAKPMLQTLVLDYPELFENKDTVIFVKIHDTITVETKVLEVDTMLVNQPCQALNYEDKSLVLSYDNGVLNYKIKSKTIKQPFGKSVQLKNPCPPCPTIQVAQDIKTNYEKKLQPSQLEVIYKWWFWLCVLAFISYCLFKIIKVYLR